MDSQASAAFAALALSDDDQLWVRPSPGEWSPGENLSHIAVVNRFFRRLHELFWPLCSLLAHPRMHNHFDATIDDVYTRPGFPHATGRLWPPEYSSQHPVSLTFLIAEVDEEHRLTRVFYKSKDQNALGNAYLYFPSIGWVNYIQSLRIAVFHDAHHFAEVKTA